METFSGEIISMLAARTRSYRIEYPLTQKELAEKSGVALRSIQMFEQGRDIQLSSLIKILDALGLSANFEMLVPDTSKRPSAFVEDKKQRKRARKKAVVEKTAFKWGDE